MKDLYERFVDSRGDERKNLRISRLLTVFWGGSATLLALYIQYFQNILSASKTLAGLFGGSLLGIFLLGVLTVRATGGGALLGAVIGFGTVAWLAAATTLSFLWYTPVGVLVTLALGYSLSFLWDAPAPSSIRGLVLGSEENVGGAESREHHWKTG